MIQKNNNPTIFNAKVHKTASVYKKLTHVNTKVNVHNKTVLITNLSCVLAAYNHVIRIKLIMICIHKEACPDSITKG